MNEDVNRRSFVTGMIAAPAVAQLTPTGVDFTEEEINGWEQALWDGARTNFWDFRLAIHPEMVQGWWPKHVAKHLQKFYKNLKAGKRPKLAIAAPPQHGKSMSVTDFIAWVAGRNPDLKTIFASYSDAAGSSRLT